MNRPGGETLSTNKSKNLFQVFPLSALEKVRKIRNHNGIYRPTAVSPGNEIENFGKCNF